MKEGKEFTDREIEGHLEKNGFLLLDLEGSHYRAEVDKGKKYAQLLVPNQPGGEHQMADRIIDYIRRKSMEGVYAQEAVEIEGIELVGIELEFSGGIETALGILEVVPEMDFYKGPVIDDRRKAYRSYTKECRAAVKEFYEERGREKGE